VVNPSDDALTAVASTLLNAKAVRVEGASLTPCFLRSCRAPHSCLRVELLQSIMAISLRFMNSKVMERVPVPDWKVGLEVSTILKALKECYPLAALDKLVSTYDKWYTLYKSLRTTRTTSH